ncbi:tail fiber domain-containing protein [Adhaeribacter radiodurans]|uniref:Tail fiber domain-containing protein n=1 Tax=Adhaeribacter radiodurans TaxID=2745197 RepID=A0A7L7L756_9BACT|nr:tail fiber domain-containing protein [Adhaeribacter radiodurans]QMU28638.1 tail fiber domain-containing protein [Adhaeribacter radiodurans]
MKKALLLLVLISATSGIISDNAYAQQNWLVGGNSLTGVGRIGSISNNSIIFLTNNEDRGRVTNAGLWGFGTTEPNAKVHINSALGQIPLRIQINGTTKFLAHNNGGLSIGGFDNPPTNGLYAAGRVGFGTPVPLAKLHVNHNSTASAPHLFLFENDSDYARLHFGNTSTSNYFAIAALPAVNNAASKLNFRYSATGDILTVQGNGKVGVNTTAPLTDLHVRHGIGSGNTDGLRVANSGANNENWTFYVLNSTGALELYENGQFRGSFDDVSGVYTAASDLKMKKDIEKSDVVLPKVLQLGVKKYHFQKNAPADDKYYGMIAQEVEKIFPEVVHHQKADDGSEHYTMDYSAFGVLAIKAIQEQQQTISSLTERIAKLEATLGTNNNSNFVNTDLIGASLEQNQPNPFNQITTFRYTLPIGTNGLLKIYEATSGKLVKTLPAPASGQVQVNAQDLKAGTYVYTLVVNGKVAASKQMLIVQ